MNFDPIDASVLRAVLRLARKRQDATEEEVALRVGAEAADVRTSLRRLDTLGWLERTPRGARLTMGGLALAVGMLPARPATARKGAPARASRAA